MKSKQHKTMNKEEVREQIQEDLTAYLDGIQSVLPEGSEDVIKGVCGIVVGNFAKLESKTMNIPKDRIVKLLVGIEEAIETAALRGEWTDELLESFGGFIEKGDDIYTVPLWKELEDLIFDLREPELVQQERKRLNEKRELHNS